MSEGCVQGDFAGRPAVRGAETGPAEVLKCGEVLKKYIIIKKPHPQM